MAIRVWSDEYNSGVEYIDNQHKQLFHLINTFEEKNDHTVSISVVASFLETLISYSEEHFKAEETFMDDNEYPLIDYHKKIHTQYRQDMLRLMQSLYAGKLKNPYFDAIETAIKWQHHVVRDDLTIFYYRKHSDFSIGEEILGRPCEIFTMDNEHLGYGTIVNIRDGDIEIECKSKQMALWHNDVLKISLFTVNHEFLCFASKVHGTKGNLIKLYANAVIKTVNDRSYFRVPVKIDATMWQYGPGDNDLKFNYNNKKPCVITILNISAGGILIETESVLQLEDKVVIKFAFHNEHFIEHCQVVRSLKKDSTLHHYGMKFIKINYVAHDSLVRQLLRLQAAHIKKTKIAEER
jgi:hemerythrin